MALRSLRPQDRGARPGAGADDPGALAHGSGTGACRQSPAAQRPPNSGIARCAMRPRVQGEGQGQGRQWRPDDRNSSTEKSWPASRRRDADGARCPQARRIPLAGRTAGQRTLAPVYRRQFQTCSGANRPPCRSGLTDGAHFKSAVGAASRPRKTPRNRAVRSWSALRATWEMAARPAAAGLNPAHHALGAVLSSRVPGLACGLPPGIAVSTSDKRSASDTVPSPSR
jgi:hypothetical protein